MMPIRLFRRSMKLRVLFSRPDPDVDLSAAPRTVRNSVFRDDDMLPANPKCAKCNGGGYIDVTSGGYDANVECSECRGTGLDSANIRLVVGLLAGCGLRVSEGCQLRIKDVDLARGSITVFEGKGDKDRQVAIPEILLPSLTKQIARATALAEIDIAERQPVQLPGRLAVSRPAWQFQARWHFLFPSPSPCAHPDTGKIVRWCIGPSIIQRAVKDAAERAGVEGKVTPHCLRHFYISELLDSGQSIKRVAEAAGHTDIRTTAGYARKECLGMKSPLDNILRFQKSA